MPTHKGLDDTSHASFKTWQCDSFGFILNALYILYAKLYVNHKGLSLAKEVNIIDSACYIDSSLAINLIETPIWTSILKM